MNELAKNLIHRIKTGSIVVNMTSDPNYEEVIKIELSNANENDYEYGLFEEISKDLPEVWECIKYPDGEDAFLYRSNAFTTQFVAHNPNNTRGAFALGEVPTTKGTVDVKGGWSSRPSVLYKLTGIKLIDVVIDCMAMALNMDIMEEIADHLGLVIDVSPYMSNMDEDGEKAWAFYKKDVKRCPECGKPVSSRYNHECQFCN